MEKNDEDAMRLGLDVIYRGLEGITDIRMELRPDSAFPHTVGVNTYEYHHFLCHNIIPLHCNNTQEL